jgi:hypothetical protein
LGSLRKVDLVCINQSNTGEQNQEVRRMDQIYRCAERVVVWLGCESEPRTTADASIPDRTFETVDNTYELLELLANADIDDLDAAVEILERTGKAADTLSLPSKFFCHKWFQRTAWPVIRPILNPSVGRTSRPYSLLSIQSICWVIRLQSGLNPDWPDC